MIIRILSEETKRKRTETFNRKRDEKAQKEIGNTYWNFIVESINEELTEKYNSNGMRRGVYFNFRCKCGKLISHRLSDVKNGHCKSCGCTKFNNPNRVEDLTGKKFGRLTVIERDVKRDFEQYKNGKNGVHWLCKCDCGNQKILSITGHQLKSGHTQSCGCYASEQIIKRNKMYSTKQNLFIELDDCKIAIKDENDNQCIIDKEDYDIIKNWYWRKIEKRGDISKGYWVTNVKEDDKYNKSVLMIHQVIAEIKYGEYDSKSKVPDHLSRDTDDNRKCNIYLKSNQNNSHNRGLSKANTSGKTGVSYNKQKGLWTAYITVNYKTIHLGDFSNLNDAIRERINAEKKYGFTCDDIVADYDEVVNE